MNPVDTCLNLVMPRGLEETVTDLLLAHPELTVSFASFPVEAHGAEVRLATAAEHVSGHAARVRMELLLSRADANALLAYLQESMPNPAVFFWIAPVLAAGRLA